MDSPRYSLELIRELAGSANPQEITISRRANLDALNYGFGFDRLCGVISNLSAEHFSKNVIYEGDEKPWDVYLVPVCVPIDDNNQEIFYVKLQLRFKNSRPKLHITSFHTSGRPI